MLCDAEAEQRLWVGSVEVDGISPFDVEGVGHIQNVAQDEHEQQHRPKYGSFK